MSRVPTKNIDYTSRDYEAYRDLLITKLQEKMPEYTDKSETDAGIVILEALANGLDILSLYVHIIANDVILPTTQSRKMAILIAECLGYVPYNQTASVYPQVFVLSTVRDTDTQIPKGTVVKTDNQGTDYLPTIYFETDADLVIPAGKLGNEQDENNNYLYTVPVFSGQSINQDVIGSSVGSPLQSFKLKYTQVLVDSIHVFVNEGQGEEEWARVDNFFGTDPDSKVYTVSVDDFDVCTIQFGNGIQGKIPAVFANGIQANYRIGGGSASVLEPNTITVMDSNVPFVQSTFNLTATVRGHDKESLESIKMNAPAAYRSRDRIVTLGDYEDLLRINFYDLQEVKAIRDEVTHTLVHLFYIMRPDSEFTPELSGEIDEYIESHSMLGTTYDIAPCVEEDIDFEIKIYISSDYNATDIEENVQTYLEQVTFSYDELTFNRQIVKSDLEAEIKEMFEGIMSVRINVPTDDIITPTNPQNVLTLGSVTFTTIPI